MFRYNALIVELGYELRPSGILGVDTLVIDREVPCLSGKSFFHAILIDLP